MALSRRSTGGILASLRSFLGSGRSPRKRIALGAVAGAAVFAVAVGFVFLASGDGQRGSGESVQGTWYAYTDYGEELVLTLNADNTATLNDRSGTWEEEPAGDTVEGGYRCTFDDGDAISFAKSGGNLAATIEASAPYELGGDFDDDSEDSDEDAFGNLVDEEDEEELREAEESETETRAFCPTEEEAESVYKERLASWKQELEDYEAAFTRALVGGWRLKSTREALVFHDDGTYSSATWTETMSDLWTGERRYGIVEGGGTWAFDESGITDAKMKFFLNHLSLRTEAEDGYETKVASDDILSLKDRDKPTSILIRDSDKWKRVQKGQSKTPYQLVSAVLTGPAKKVDRSGVTDAAHKSTLCIYDVDAISYDGPNTRSKDTTFSSHDLDADGTNDTLECHMKLPNINDESEAQVIRKTVLSVNGAEYTLTDDIRPTYCLVGLLTMDNDANFIYVRREDRDDERAETLLQYRDGELEPVASSLWLGDNVRHPRFDSVTTSGDTVTVTLNGQPVSTGNMYFTYKLRYGDGRLSSMGSTTDSLEYLYLDLRNGETRERGVYQMRANRKVSCRAEASDESSVAFVVKKGQKATFEQAKVVNSTLWFKIRRVSDGAEGWFANGTEYEDPLPFAGFMQSG